LSTPTSVSQRPAVLADALPGAWLRDILLILSGALLMALLAQIEIKVPGSAVPITGQTLGVVIVGTSLGAYRGGASLALYALLGLALPFYAGGDHGVDVITGASGGYIIGFIVAAFLIGKLAERGGDRKVLLAFAVFCVGQLAVFGVGVPWLKASTDMSWSEAIHDGFTIFIFGGLVKAAIAAVAAPLAWRAVKSTEE
jgi:biotin transport system substrate-specific component